jgi:DNA-3-methyladenine glycosylase II
MVEDGLEAMPTPKEVEERAVRWSPNRSLASLYLWESLHAVPQ